MDALAWLGQVAKAKPQPLYAVFGEEEFLKRQVLHALESVVLGDADPAFARSNFTGDSADWATVRAELETLPFLAPRRLIVVEQADAFVTKYRPQLEKYVGQPAAQGTLILDVKTWAATTKLAKLFPDPMTLKCAAPAPAKLPAWCVEWSKNHHRKRLESDAAQWLVELVGPEMGLLDSELAKIATAVGEQNSITRADVDRFAGRTRQAEVFKVLDAIGEGKAGLALGMLARLFEHDEEPLRLLGAFGSQLRRLAQVAGLTIREKMPLASAMEEAGVPPFVRRGMEQQIKHLGRRRLEKLYDWLIEADQGMKGGSSLTPRQVLERLVVKLARPREG